MVLNRSILDQISSSSQFGILKQHGEKHDSIKFHEIFVNYYFISQAKNFERIKLPQLQNLLNEG